MAWIALVWFGLACLLDLLVGRLIGQKVHKHTILIDTLGVTGPIHGGWIVGGNGGTFRPYAAWCSSFPLVTYLLCIVLHIKSITKKWLQS